VFVAGIAFAAVGTLEAVLYMQAQTLQSPDVFDYASPAFGEGLRQAFAQYVPIAIGVFASLWGIAPIRGTERLAGAILKSVVALAVAVVLATIVAGIRIVADNQLALNPPEGVPVDSRIYVLIAGSIANSAWVALSASAGFILAAGLGMWGWLRHSLVEPLAG
jgi:hypothetical protein